MGTIIRIILGILLVAGIFIVGKKLVHTIQEPTQQISLIEKRSTVVQDRLSKIGDLQKVYKNIHGKFASTFDTLAMSIESDSIAFIKEFKIEGDTTGATRKEERYVMIKDSLFKDYPYENLDLVPYTDGMKFAINAGRIEMSSTSIQVFEVKTDYKNFLEGTNPKFWDIDKHVGQEIRIGSMEKNVTTGNW